MGTGYNLINRSEVKDLEDVLNIVESRILESTLGQLNSGSINFILAYIKEAYNIGYEHGVEDSN